MARLMYISVGISLIIMNTVDNLLNDNELNNQKQTEFGYRL